MWIPGAIKSSRKEFMKIDIWMIKKLAVDVLESSRDESLLPLSKS